MRIAQGLCTPAILLLFAGVCWAGLPHGPGEFRLNGALWWLSPQDIAMSADDWAIQLDRMSRLGINTLVLTGPYFEAPSGDAPDFPDWLLKETDRRGWSVYVDTIAPANWWTMEKPTNEAERVRQRVDVLASRYGHHASFRGWYVPYELYVFWDAQADFVEALFQSVTGVCKTRTPDKEVMISPFFILDKEGYLGSFRYAEPAEYKAFWERILGASRIDIVALQDSGEHLACYTLAERRPFFEAMKAACAAKGVRLWGNVELGELNVASLAEYEALFGRKTHVNDPRTTSHWRGVPADKLRRKLNLAGEYCEQSVSWGFREFISPAIPQGETEIFKAYARVLEPGGGKAEEGE